MGTYLDSKVNDLLVAVTSIGQFWADLSIHKQPYRTYHTALLASFPLLALWLESCIGAYQVVQSDQHEFADPPWETAKDQEIFYGSENVPTNKALAHSLKR
jgi:hypothetical protein